MSTILNETAELFREPGEAILSPSQMANVFRLELGELAEALGVHRNTLRLSPSNTRAQERLRAFHRVFLALLDLMPDINRAAFHMRNTPIRTLNYRTLFEAVRDGEELKALRYLQTISTGQNG